MTKAVKILSAPFDQNGHSTITLALCTVFKLLAYGNNNNNNNIYETFPERISVKKQEEIDTISI